MKDAITELGKAQLITDYLDITVQLEKGTGTRPVLWLLRDARQNATVSMRKLVEVDASETDAIRSLQAEIRLYGDLMESCARMMVRGKEADREIDDDERRQFAEMLTPEAARDLGIETPPED